MDFIGGKMANFKDVTEVSLSDFSDKELDSILSKQNEEEVMHALGYVKKDSNTDTSQYFYADFSGEFYRFKQEDVSPDFTLSSTVPEFIKLLVKEEKLEALLRDGSITRDKVLVYAKNDKIPEQIINPGDVIIRLDYAQRLSDDEVYIVPESLFNSLFHSL